MKKVAVLGYGTVGRGVCRVITENAELLKKKTGEDVTLGYVCDLRDIPDAPYGDRHIKDFNIILNDPEVAVVAELTGARNAAYNMSKQAIIAGKSVVTSNKEVVAAYGAELLQLAAENNVSYLFEASVGGAIPIIHPLCYCLSTDHIYEICGILNGTTNYILTRMEKADMSYSDALAEAQSLGYAEPNPDADVLGKDAARKIAILGACISGKLISPELIPTRGIVEITQTHIRLAEALGGRIKLIARAAFTDGKLQLSVEPCFVSLENPLSFTDGVFNSVLVRCTDAGDLMFYGRGAGSIPTASAVVGDIADAVNGLKPVSWTAVDSSPDTAKATGGIFAVYKGIIKSGAEYCGYSAYLCEDEPDGEPVFTLKVIK